MINAGIYVESPLPNMVCTMKKLILHNEDVDYYSGMSVSYIRDCLKDEDVITVFTSSNWINKKFIEALEKRRFMKRRFIFMCTLERFETMKKLLKWNE